MIGPSSIHFPAQDCPVYLVARCGRFWLLIPLIGPSSTPPPSSTVNGPICRLHPFPMSTDGLETICAPITQGENAAEYSGDTNLEPTNRAG